MLRAFGINNSGIREFICFCAHRGLYSTKTDQRFALEALQLLTDSSLQHDSLLEALESVLTRLTGDIGTDPECDDNEFFEALHGLAKSQCKVLSESKTERARMLQEWICSQGMLRPQI